MIRPVAIALKAVVLRSAVVVPLLAWLPSTETRRLRLHHYLKVHSEKPDVVACFRTHLSNRASELEERRRQLWDHPETHAWWCDRVAPLRPLPRSVVVAPLCARLKATALLDRLESGHICTMYWAYFLFDIAACLSLIRLSSRLVRDGVQTFMRTAPRELAQRISRIADWITSGVGLTAMALYAVSLRAFGEVADFGDRRGTTHCVQKGLGIASKALLRAVYEFPTLLSDGCLLLSFGSLGRFGQTFAVLRVGYRLYPLVVQLPCLKATDWRASLSASETRQPTPWMAVRENEALLETGERKLWDRHLNRLWTAATDHRYDSSVSREAQRLVDCYTIVQLAGEGEEPEDTDPDKRIPSERWNRLSVQARDVLLNWTENEYDSLPNKPLLTHAIAKRPGISRALEPFALANPAEEYLYLWEQGGVMNRFWAVCLLPWILFSPWTASQNNLPWGKHGDLHRIVPHKSEGEIYHVARQTALGFNFEPV